MLRKKTFKDRLQWAVSCTDDKEYDQFDNEKTNYLLGVKMGMIICGTRVMDMQDHNMWHSIFSSFFQTVVLPKGNFIESTRFFVDKERASQLVEHNFPNYLLV